MTISEPFWIGKTWTVLLLISVRPASLAGCDPIGSIDLTGVGSGPSRPELLTVRGTVTAATDGRPLSGVAVEQRFFMEADPERPKAITDSGGRYSFVKKDSCSICITPIGFTLVAHLDGFNRGFEPRVEQLPVESWQKREVRDTVFLDATQNFALRPTRPITLSIRGRVTSASTGEPLEIVTVTVTNHPWGNFLYAPFDVPRDSAQTDADGRYFVASSHFCAISGSSCFVSLYITAVKDDLFEDRILEDLTVAGDSLSLRVNFDGLE